jgi:Family of unknown function (DUF6515)
MKSLKLMLIALGCVAVCTGALADDRHDHHGDDRRSDDRGSHEHHDSSVRGRLEIDAHFGHNRYYPPIGVVTRDIPSGHYTTYHRGVPYYFHDGIWYRHGGYGFTVIRPPVGLFVNFLPPFYTTVWFGGLRYYYADNVYYRWDTGRNVYIVSEPPAGSNADTSPPATSNEDTFVYPKNGQSDEQKAKDRYECHRWATDETGFDPTKTSGGVDASEASTKRNDYKRAEAACLDARGYSVK